MASHNWCFTHHFPDQESLSVHNVQVGLEELLEPFRGKAFVCAQVEVAPETGRVHVQGVIHVQKLARKSALIKISDQLHYTKCAGTLNQNITYCTKAESQYLTPEGTPVQLRFGDELLGPGSGHRSDLDHALAVLKEHKTSGAMVAAVARECPAVFVKYHAGFEKLARLSEAVYAEPVLEEFRGWQTELMTYVSAPRLTSDGKPADDRSIICVLDLAGGAGKSRFTRHLVDHAGAICLSGSLADMKHGYLGQPTVVFDLTRSAMETSGYLYTFAEMLKNGVIYKTKYASALYRFVPPMVIFMTNAALPEGVFSADRLVVQHLRTIGGETFSSWDYGLNTKLPRVFEAIPPDELLAPF